MDNKTRTKEEILGKQTDYYCNMGVCYTKDAVLKAMEEYASQFTPTPQLLKLSKVLTELRNKLYDELPKGDVDAWELLQTVKWHINDIDNLMSQIEHGEDLNTSSNESKGDEDEMLKSDPDLVYLSGKEFNAALRGFKAGKQNTSLAGNTTPTEKGEKLYRWVKLSEKYPAEETPIVLRLDSEQIRLGNLYTDDQCYMIHVQANGAHDSYDVVAHRWVKIEWLEEAPTTREGDAIGFAEMKDFFRWHMESPWYALDKEYLVFYHWDTGENITFEQLYTLYSQAMKREDKQ